MQLPLSPNISEPDAVQSANGEGCTEPDEKHGVVESQEEQRGGRVSQETHWGSMEEFCCMPCADGGEDPDAIDEGVEIEAEVQRAATDPGQPTQSEREEHDLTHFPFRPWCMACVRGRAKDAPSRKVIAPFAESILPRVRMDSCCLTEMLIDQVVTTARPRCKGLDLQSPWR